MDTLFNTSKYVIMEVGELLLKRFSENTKYRKAREKVLETLLHT